MRRRRTRGGGAVWASPSTLGPEAPEDPGDQYTGQKGTKTSLGVKFRKIFIDSTVVRTTS